MIDIRDLLRAVKEAGADQPIRLRTSFAERYEPTAMSISIQPRFPLARQGPDPDRRPPYNRPPAQIVTLIREDLQLPDGSREGHWTYQGIDFCRAFEDTGR